MKIGLKIICKKGENMDAKMMLDLGKVSGLNTVRECYENVMCHYDAFFLIDNINDEIKAFEDDLDKYELELTDAIEEAYAKLKGVENENVIGETK
jgi:hypothetical protein